MWPELVLWTVVFGFMYIVEAGIITDHCDWNGSGLTLPSERAVRPVYLRCREGSVSWLYPRGALRIIFRPPMPAGERDFRVCLRVIRKPDPPDLFHDLDFNDTDKVDRFPARLFVEGSRKLIPLYAPDDGDARELRCFRSRHGGAAVYMEADPETGPVRRLAFFKYETKPIEKKHYDPTTAECRPCSEEEMELAFCSSDLVSRGMFVSSEQRHDMDSTQLTLELTKLIRATGRADSRYWLDIAGDNEYFRYDIDNNLERTHHRNHRRKARSLHAHIHVSSVCEASAGAGEFLVMARRRLGRYYLACAPRIEDWKALVEKRKADGDSYCILHH